MRMILNISIIFMSRRIERINQLLKEEISSLILKEFDFNKDTIITVTGVKTSSDLRATKVKVSIMPFLKAGKVLKLLNFQAFNFQKLLNKKLKIRIIPKIKFELDKSEEKADKIIRLFKKIKNND